MSSVSTSAFVQVWGTTPFGDRCVIGAIAIDRSGPTVVYTAQAGAEECDFHTEPAAGYWLARRFPRPLHFLFIGRSMSIQEDDQVPMQPNPLGELLRNAR